MIAKDLTRVTCDRCDHNKVIEAGAAYPSDWKKFSGPSKEVIDLCSGCTKSFSIWMTILKPR